MIIGQRKRPFLLLYTHITLSNKFRKVKSLWQPHCYDLLTEKKDKKIRIFGVLIFLNVLLL